MLDPLVKYDVDGAEMCKARRSCLHPITLLVEQTISVCDAFFYLMCNQACTVQTNTLAHTSDTFVYKQATTA